MNDYELFGAHDMLQAAVVLRLERLIIGAAKQIVSLDFETTSTRNLGKVGAHTYSLDPSLVVTVFVWAWDDDPVQSVTLPKRLPPEVELHLASGGKFRAWNCQFEGAILQNHYGLEITSDQVIDTMEAALYSGLPASLGEAGPAIGANIVKDASARKLMLQMSRPRGFKPDGNRTYWHEDDPAKLEALRRYCERDVETERSISKLIAPLPPTEVRVSPTQLGGKPARNRGRPETCRGAKETGGGGDRSAQS